MLKKRITRLWSMMAFMAFMAIMGFSGLTFAVDVIIDNGDAGTTPAGTWLTSSGANPYGTSSLYSNEAGASYVFQANLSAGRYDVYLHWTYWSNRCTSVQVDIYDWPTLLDSVTVNQQANGGQWNVHGHV